MAEASELTAPSKRPRSRVVWTLVISGLVIGVVGFIVCATRLFGPLFSPSLDVPGSHTMTLDAGRWVVFEENGSRTTVGPVHLSRSDSPRIRVVDVEVAAADGDVLPVRAMKSAQTITRGSSSYFGVAEFEVNEGGKYTVTINSASGGDVLVGREFVDGIMSNLVWIAMCFLGLLLIAAGAVVAVARAFIHPSTPAPEYD